MDSRRVLRILALAVLLAGPFGAGGLVHGGFHALPGDRSPGSCAGGAHAPVACAADVAPDPAPGPAGDGLPVPHDARSCPICLAVAQPGAAPTPAPVLVAPGVSAPLVAAQPEATPTAAAIPHPPVRGPPLPA